SSKPAARGTDAREHAPSTRIEPRRRALRRLLPVRLANNSMELGSRRCGEADEDDDAITARIAAEGVDAEIGLPVINGPNVAGLIDAQIVILNVSTVSGKGIRAGIAAGAAIG